MREEEVTIEESYDLDSDAAGLKKEEEKAINEFQRIIDAFNRILTFKKKNREILEKRINESTQNRFDTFEKLKKVTRNMETYQKDIKNTEENLEEIGNKEAWLKEKYNEILRGKSIHLLSDPERDGNGLFSDIFYDIFETDIKLQTSSNQVGRDMLENRRNDFMSRLNKLFNRLDSELSDIEKEKNRLQKIDTEIRQKMEKGEMQRALLQKNYSVFTEDIRRKKEELEASIRGEKVLVEEYNKILSKIISAIEISQEVDNMLFSLLSKVDEEHKVSEERDKIDIIQEDDILLKGPSSLDNTRLGVIEFPQAVAPK
ncbi:MAG: hypothetical protein ACC630_07965 [Nitrospinota bacterium]